MFLFSRRSAEALGRPPYWQNLFLLDPRLIYQSLAQLFVSLFITRLSCASSWLMPALALRLFGCQRYTLPTELGQMPQLNAGYRLGLLIQGIWK